MITRRHFGWSYGGYDAAKPPPLGFTTPPAQRWRGNGTLARGGGLAVSMLPPRLMMDPTNPATWQRPYRFTR